MSIGFLCFVPGCRSDAPDHQGELEFEYYPDKNIYYNTASLNFIYSLDGAKTWDSLKFSSKDAFSSLGKKQKIYSKTPEIWNDNEVHLKTYGGTLFNITDDGDNTQIAGVDEVSDKRKVSKTTGAKRNTQQNRKGVKGFFDRIFKKKDKK